MPSNFLPEDKELLIRIDERTRNTHDHVKSIDKRLTKLEEKGDARLESLEKDIEGKYVSQKEFIPVRNWVTAILSAIITGWGIDKWLGS
jgi:hypothetical protein